MQGNLLSSVSLQAVKQFAELACSDSHYFNVLVLVVGISENLSLQAWLAGAYLSRKKMFYKLLLLDIPCAASCSWLTKNRIILGVVEETDSDLTFLKCFCFRLREKITKKSTIQYIPLFQILVKFMMALYMYCKIIELWFGKCLENLRGNKKWLEAPHKL